MRHDSSISHLPGARRVAHRVLRARGFLALLVALAETSAGCTIVIGERPDTEPDGDANVDADAGSSGQPDREQNEPDGDVTPVADAGSDANGSDANGSDAGRTDASSLDSDVAPDASEDGSSGQLDAASEAGEDASAEDAGQDSGDSPDTGSDSGPSCTTPTTWYPDDDGDGFGRAAGAVQACAKPAGKWSENDDDCSDSSKDAFPGQTAWFDEPYSISNGQDSFDYNCSGKEEGDPGQASLAEGCGALLELGLLCTEASGYMPRGDRSGGTRNSMCGSRIIAHCQIMVLSCVPGSPEQTTTAYRCR